MFAFKELSKALKSAAEIPFDDTSKIIMMSDCHRGDGSYADDFAKNQNLYFAALTHYYNENYTYIELGDGDELWKNKNLNIVKQIHSHAFWLLSKFHKEGRLHILYGNHDIVKRKDAFVKSNMYYIFDDRVKKDFELFKGIKVHESIILKHKETGNKILLVHGHQADYDNDRLWRLMRFLVRHLWRPLEVFGVNDPTSAAKNYKKYKKVEKHIINWVKSENQAVIAGHTHRPVFPEPGKPPYFNDGSCVHPRCITGIEISDGYIRLVKWAVNTKDDGTMYVCRETLDGPVKLSEYFNCSHEKELVYKP